MIAIKGISLIKDKRYLTFRKNLNAGFADFKSLYGDLKIRRVFIRQVENFGRFDDATKISICAVGLALFDSGIDYSPGLGNFGIISTNRDGSLEANKLYFQDYIHAGRKLARGNLFIYTLPSSPIGEISIHFGLRGPMFYAGFQKDYFAQALKCAKNLISSGQADNIIAVGSNLKQAICLVLSAKHKSTKENHSLDREINNIIKTKDPFAYYLKLCKENSK